MSVNSEMTAIADLIRGLRGVSGKMGLDAMKGHLQDEQDGLDSALAALTEKGVTVPAGTKVDGLAALIAAIEAGGGVSTGTITISDTTSDIVVTHGLGVKPYCIAVLSTLNASLSNNTSSVLNFLYVIKYNNNIRYGIKLMRPNSSSVTFSYGNTEDSATSNSGTFLYCRISDNDFTLRQANISSSGLGAGNTLIWVAVAEG